MSPARRALLGLAAVPVVALGVLAVEVELARRGPNLPDEPFVLDGRYGAGTRRLLRVLWLGDSTAAGVGASSPAATLPVQVARRLDRPVELTVLAVSGDRVGDVLDDQMQRVAAAQPDLILISVGTNDVTHLTSVADFGDRYRSLVRRLPDDSEIVLLGVPDLGSPRRFAQPLRSIAGVQGRRLDEVVEAVAHDEELRYVDIAASTGPAFRDEPSRYFSADRYHPSDEGYRLWADAVVAVLDEAVP